MLWPVATRFRLQLSAALTFGLLCTTAWAQPPAQKSGSGQPPEPFVALGRTDQGTPLLASANPRIFSNEATSPLVLVVLPAPINPDEGNHQEQEVNRFKTELAAVAGQPVRVLAVSLPPGVSFPPKGSAYNTKGEVTAATLWRALAWLGVDAVIGFSNETKPEWAENSLVAAVRRESVAGMGHIPSARLPITLLDQPVSEYWNSPPEGSRLEDLKPVLTGKERSEVRKNFERRVKRTPQQVAAELSRIYGHELKTVMYQPALAVVARRQFATMIGEAGVQEDVARILKPYLEKSANKVEGNGSVVSGHLVFADWALATKDPRAVELVRRAADLGFDQNGNPLAVMPSHSEMSDAVFMGGPILTSAARLTGEAKYLDMARRQFAYMKKLDLRDDGLYRHSPLCEAAWGRGNGFPQLGFALALTDLQAIRDDKEQKDEFRKQADELFKELLVDFEAHARALIKNQDVTGMWRQVIDEESAYREMTATCMIGFSLNRAVRLGWVTDPEFKKAADQAWKAVLPRISEKGVLIDVCTGTGKQKSLEDYFQRTAILDVDERGGAMALQFAVERCLNN